MIQNMKCGKVFHPLQLEGLGRNKIKKKSAVWSIGNVCEVCPPLSAFPPPQVTQQIGPDV